MKEKFLYNNIINKEPKINVWLAFPGVYSFAMSSIGYLSIFKNLDENKEIFVERISTDTKTTRIKREDVDVIGFSNSFETDIINIFKILDKYNIPKKASERSENDPLVFAGGPVVSANPMPYTDFFDFFAIGDANETNNDIFNILIKMKGMPKEKILDELSKVKGVFTPKVKQDKVFKRTDNLPSCLATPILTEKSFFPNTYIIEIARGCPQKCAFCIASYLNLPVRFPPYEEIIKAIDEGLKYTDKLAFLGAMICAHPDIKRIFAYIDQKLDEGRKIELSVSSLRADKLDIATVKTLVRCGQKHVTIAVEAGSEMLRNRINKNLTDEEVLNSIKTMREGGLKGAKVYAMLGLPTESMADIQALIDLMVKMKNENKGFDLTLSVSTFVPKAQTPFQWCARDNVKNLEEKLNLLRKELHRAGITFRAPSIDWDDIQALLSRGDSRLGEYLLEVYGTKPNIGGYKQTYRKFEKEKKLPPFDFFARREIGLDEELPWEIIEMPVCKEGLKAEFTRLSRKY